MRSETTSSYVATVRCCRAEVKYLTRMGKTRRFRSSCAKARTRIFCWRETTECKDMRCTPGTTQGVRRSKNARNAKDNRHRGNITRGLLLTFLLRRLASTLAAAFRMPRTPDLRYLKRRSNHSATVARITILQEVRQEPQE